MVMLCSCEDDFSSKCGFRRTADNEKTQTLKTLSLTLHTSGFLHHALAKSVENDLTRALRLTNPVVLLYVFFAGFCEL